MFYFLLYLWQAHQDVVAVDEQRDCGGQSARLPVSRRFRSDRGENYVMLFLSHVLCKFLFIFGSLKKGNRHFLFICAL